MASSTGQSGQTPTIIYNSSINKEKCKNQGGKIPRSCGCGLVEMTWSVKLCMENFQYRCWNWQLKGWRWRHCNWLVTALRACPLVVVADDKSSTGQWSQETGDKRARHGMAVNKKVSGLIWWNATNHLRPWMCSSCIWLGYGYSRICIDHQRISCLQGISAEPNSDLNFRGFIHFNKFLPAHSFQNTRTCHCMMNIQIPLEHKNFAVITQKKILGSIHFHKKKTGFRKR